MQIRKSWFFLTTFAVMAMLSASCFTAAAADTPPTDNNAQLQGQESDPLEPFNSAMFTFNLKLDDYVLHPVASGYAKVLPTPAREAIGRAIDNVSVLPRFANNLFQLRIPQAGSEVAHAAASCQVRAVAGQMPLVVAKTA